VSLFVSNRRLARRTVREHDTGERIVVHSPQRWYGTATVNVVTGRYLIELCSPTGTRCDVPLEILGLPVDHTYFGTGWPQKSRRRTTTKRSISSRRHPAPIPHLAELAQGLHRLTGSQR